MSYVTRDLLSFALSRTAGELVTLVTKFLTANGDGSYSRGVPEEVQSLARVVDLQPREIERLASAGITVTKGVSISIVGELDKAPDQVVRADGTILRVVSFTIAENATIMIGDVPPVGNAA